MGSIARTSAPAPSANGLATVTVEPSLEASAAHSVEDALSLISYPWETKLPSWSIHFLPGRPDYRALTLANQRLVEVYVRTDMTTPEIAGITAHELGRAVDAMLLSAADHDTWRTSRRFASSAPWYPAAASPDLATGAGDFAEAFATWQVGKLSLSQLGDQPDAAQFEVLARLSRLAATDPQPQPT
jgi:hypothetical protein